MKAFASICNELVRVAAKNAILALVLAVVLPLLCLPGYAQLNLGSIAGAITDQSGGAIVGATVNVIDVARGITRPLISDSAGEYAAPSLTPGTYTVHVEAMGFKTEDRQDVLLQVGQSVRVDVVLQPGQQNQTITVTGELPMIDTSSAQLGSVLENLSVEELPVNGRNYQYMLEDRPGVVLARAGGPGGFTGNGAPSNSIAWMFDGLFDGNIYASGASVVGGGNSGPDQPSILPLDSIQEISIIQVPKAEFGWRSGNHINVGLKSGTNTLHGTAYAFGRDTDLNAKNPFLLSTEPKAPMAMEQFGASINGPIKKDKLFYFANYEGERYNVGVPTLQHEPTTADLTGSSGATGNSIPDALYDILQNHPTVVPSALSVNLAGCQSLTNAVGGVTSGTFTATQVAMLRAMSVTQLAAGSSAPASLLGGNGGLSTTYVSDFVGSGVSNNGIIKVDYHPNDHNAFNAEWFDGGSPFTSPGAAIEPYWVSSVKEWASAVRGVWIWTPNSSWVNDFRFGYEYENIPGYILECQKPGIGPDYAALGFDGGEFGWPCSALSNPIYGGFPPATVSGFGALGTGGGQDLTEHYDAVNDSISYTRGKHVFKFGGEIRFDFFEGLGGPPDLKGTLSFGTVAPFTGATPLEDFMSGVASNGGVLVGQPYDAWHFNQYAAYAQDDWRVLSRLTLNLGLRYEHMGSLWAVGNHAGNFEPNNPSLGPTGLIQQTPGHNVYAPSPIDFAPRVGLAWDVTGKGTTVVRASFNLLFSTTITLNNLISSAGSYLQGIPTGFTFYNTNGSTFAGPGNIKSGAINLATAQLPWEINVPVFNTNTSALACGDGVAPVNPVAGASALEPAPCYLQAINPNIGHYGQTYYRTFGIQHAFTNNLSLNVSYVGNHSSGIMGVTNINSPTPGAKNTAANGYIEQARRPYNAEYPFYGVINYETDFQEGNYNSLQSSLTQRIGHGVNFTAAYTLAHYLDDAVNPMVSNNPIIDYGNSSVDIRNYFTFTMTYQVPGRKSPGQMLEGWELNTTTSLQAGLPLAAIDSTNDISGTGQLTDRWTLAGNPRDFKTGGPGPIPCWGIVGSSFSKSSNCTTVNTPNAGSVMGSGMPALCQAAAAVEAVNSSLPANTPNATGTAALAAYGCYMMGASVIVPPAQGTYGTMARDELYYKGFHNWNISATKTWKFRERYSAQFRADFYNVLNRTSYAAPSANLASPATFGEAQSTPDISNYVIGNGPRKIQFGLKLIF